MPKPALPETAVVTGIEARRDRSALRLERRWKSQTFQTDSTSDTGNHAQWSCENSANVTFRSDVPRPPTPKDGPNEMLWPSTITLSRRYYDSIKAAPIPVDLRALAVLRTQGGGGFHLDMYTWLAQRMSYLRSSTLVPWDLLAKQFGSQYSPGSQRFFKRDLLKTLPKVLAVYPAAKVKPTAEGLLLSPSRTPISPRR